MLPLKGGSALPKSRHISAKMKYLEKLQLDVSISNKDLHANSNPKGTKPAKTTCHSANKNNSARKRTRIQASTPLAHHTDTPGGLSFDKYLLFNLYNIKHL
tara:strand:+ start:195 stop:497 length:303 start_codon:yes stop_codon:yes gene_type:complete